MRRMLALCGIVFLGASGLARAAEIDPQAGYVARQLEESGAPLLAAARILAEVRHGFIDMEEGGRALRLVDEYAEREPYERARFLADALGTAWGAAEHNHFWLAQANGMLQREAFADIPPALRELRAPLDPETTLRRQGLLGLAYLLQSRFPEAQEALKARQGFPSSNLVDHFNFAMSLIGQGKTVEGMALLDELAEIPVEGENNRAIRDRVNMALGWVWLKTQKGGSARPAFKRVRLEGPFSNMALLGLAWAELIPDGSLQQVRFQRTLTCADLKNPPKDIDISMYQSFLICIPDSKTFNYTFQRRFAYEPGKMGKARLQEALKPLQVLSPRATHDPAVQESLLALGYVYRELGAHAESVRAYKQAASRYEAESARLAALQSELQKPGSDPRTLLEQGPADQFADLRSSRAYAGLLADLEALRLCRQAHQQTMEWLEQQQPSSDRRRQLIDFVRRHADRQQEAFAAAEKALDAGFRRLVLDELAIRRERLRQYHSDALLAIAQQYDQSSSRE